MHARTISAWDEGPARTRSFEAYELAARASDERRLDEAQRGFVTANEVAWS